MAAGSSAFAPSPYTVSVGNATSSPARIISAARAISLLWKVLFAIAGNFAGVLPHQERVHEAVDVAIEYAIDVADGEPAAQILHHAIGREHVAADLAAEIDIELGVFELLILGA